MSDKRDFCPICGPLTTGFSFLTENHPQAVQCLRCGLGIERTLKFNPDSYSRANYDQNRNKGAGDDRWARFHHDSAVAVDRLAQLGFSALGKGKLWVDVGCGNAAMLCELGRNDWQTLGVEADEPTCLETSRMTGVSVVPTSMWMAAARDNATSVISAGVTSFIDSLEHMLDPVGVLRAAVRNTSSAGAIVIELPDLDSGIGPDFDSWKHRRNGTFTEHIWHFSEKSLETLRQRYFPNVRTNLVNRPMEGRLQVVWAGPHHDGPAQDKTVAPNIDTPVLTNTITSG